METPKVPTIKFIYMSYMMQIKKRVTLGWLQINKWINTENPFIILILAWSQLGKGYPQ